MESPLIKGRLSSWTPQHLFSLIPIFPMTPVYPRDISASIGIQLENGLATAIVFLAVRLLALTIHVATWPAPQCICVPLPPPKPRIVLSKRLGEIEQLLPSPQRILEKNEESSFPDATRRTARSSQTLYFSPKQKEIGACHWTIFLDNPPERPDLRIFCHAVLGVKGQPLVQVKSPRQLSRAWAHFMFGTSVTTLSCVPD